MILLKRLAVLLLLITNCSTGNLTVVADLPTTLNEVSGIAPDKRNTLTWMINDSGNKAMLYGLNASGTIAKTFKVNAKNRDWEDLTMDDDGNLYIGNFGNNDNNSKKLSILKIKAEDLASDQKKIDAEIIRFSYPEQKKFPPKKSKRHFDCEAFFHLNNHLYLFTKSRAPKTPGKTNVYKLPATQGDYDAKFLGTFTTCNDENECWVTAADINATDDKLALLTENSVFVFSELNLENFFASKVNRYMFDYASQKESVAFKNDSTLLIADEYAGNEGGNLYEFRIK